MINQIDNTEDKVLDAARTVFRRKGFSGARMQEIARTAGVNKALLNYYYRSKEKLFKRVFEEAFREFIPTVLKVLDGDLPLDMKIYKTVDIYTRMLINNKDLPLFVLNEIREHPDKVVDLFPSGESFAFKNLEAQLQSEYRNGMIRKITTPMFLLNLLSLTVFPFIVEPVLRNVMHMTEENYLSLIMERKKMVPNMIIESLRPNS